MKNVFKVEQKDILNTVKLILARYIKDNNMRNTPEREAILDLIYNTKGMLTHNDIYEKLLDSFRVSKATVYNTLNLLTTLGLVVQHVNGNVIKYEACYGQRDNMVTVCTRCGKMQKMESKTISYAFTNAKYKRFHLEQVVATIYGICSTCQSVETRRRRKRESQ